MLHLEHLLCCLFKSADCSEIRDEPAAMATKFLTYSCEKWYPHLIKRSSNFLPTIRFDLQAGLIDAELVHALGSSTVGCLYVLQSHFYEWVESMWLSHPRIALCYGFACFCNFIFYTQLQSILFAKIAVLI